MQATDLGFDDRAAYRARCEIVNSKTADRWSFVEQGDAHVAICDPASALCSVAMKRSAPGATRFISLVEDVSLAQAGTSLIRDPIRATELIELLNLVSSTLSCEAPQPDWPAPTHPEVAGALLSTMDGFEVAASVGAQVSPKKMAAMTSGRKRRDRDGGGRSRVGHDTRGEKQPAGVRPGRGQRVQQ